MGNMKLFLRNPFGEFGNIIEGTVWLFDEDLQVRARQESWSFARSHHQVGGTRWWAPGGGHQVVGTRWGVANRRRGNEVLGWGDERWY